MFIKLTPKSRINFIVFLFTILVEIICCIGTANVIYDLICTFSFILFFVFFLYQDTIFFIKYINVLVGIVGTACGVIICEEMKIYLSELGVYSSHFGSLPLLELFFTIKFFSLYISDRQTESILAPGKKKIDSINRCIYMILKPLIFLGGLLVFSFVFTKPCFMYRMDRFQYAQAYLNNFGIEKLANLIVFFSPVLIIPFFRGRDINLKNVISELFIPLIPVLLFYIWIGHKFGIFFRIICYYIVPLSCKIKLNRNAKKMAIKILISIGVFLFLLLFLFYTFTARIDMWSAIFRRIAMQGQLWWKIYGIYENQAPRYFEILDEITHIFVPGPDYNHGIYKLMYLTTPRSIVNTKLATGSRYSASGLELPFYYFKEPGVVFVAIFVAFIYSQLTNAIIKSAKNLNCIDLMIFQHILVMFQAASSQGDWEAFWSVKMLIFIIALIVSHLMYRNNKMCNQLCRK